jgi:hypothetical protein
MSGGGVDKPGTDFGGGGGVGGGVGGGGGGDSNDPSTNSVLGQIIKEHGINLEELLNVSLKSLIRKRLTLPRNWTFSGPILHGLSKSHAAFNR